MAPAVKRAPGLEPINWTEAGPLRQLGEFFLGYMRSEVPNTLTCCQLVVLGLICETPGPITLRVIALALRVEKSTITRAIAVLESYGAINRTKNPEDRRKMLIYPTRRGEEWIRTLQYLWDRASA